MVILIRLVGCDSTRMKFFRKANDQSTGNLTKHANLCQPKASTGDVQVMRKFTGGYSREGFRWLLLRWVIAKNRPYTIVQDPELGDIFRMLHSKVDIPCANTLALDIKYVHEFMKGKLIAVFKVCLLFLSLYYSTNYISEVCWCHSYCPRRLVLKKSKFVPRLNNTMVSR